MMVYDKHFEIRKEYSKSGEFKIAHVLIIDDAIKDLLGEEGICCNKCHGPILTPFYFCPKGFYFFCYDCQRKTIIRQGERASNIICKFERLEDEHAHFLISRLELKNNQKEVLEDDQNKNT